MYRIQNYTLSGWEDDEGFEEFNTLGTAVLVLAEFIQEVYTAHKQGFLEQPYNIEDYRILHGDTVVAQFGE